MRGLGTRARKAYPLRTGDQPIDELSPPYLQFVRGTPVGAKRRLFTHGFQHLRMAVAEQQRAVAAEVVDVFVAVDIPLARSGGAGRIDGVWQQRTAVVRQSGRNDLARTAVELRRASRAGP